MQKFERNFTILYVVVLFGLALNLVPLVSLDYLGRMPGDLGDARLNNYFLENVYSYLIGRSDSLWNLGFFHPFSNVIGFSENLFGSSPVYVTFRFLGFESDTSFQSWFLFGYFVNFFAAYYVLRKLGGGTIAASIGALIFAFALPTSAHVSHVQLHYRFGVPLALFYLFEYLEIRKLRSLMISGGWLVWQFYCGIYIGFFLTLAAILSIFAFLIFQKFSKKQPVVRTVLSYYNNFVEEPQNTKRRFFMLVFIYISAILVLFYPYLQYTVQYGTVRSWDEIAPGLPRIESYLLTDASKLWGTYSKYLGENIPVRGEHQMFVGIFPLALAIFGALAGYKTSSKIIYAVMAGVVLGFFIITLSVSGKSIWILFHKLPLASVIRVMTRFDQVLLFPIAYFCMLAADRIMTDKNIAIKFILTTVLTSALLVEMSLVETNSSERKLWRDRLVVKEQLIPSDISPDKILFFEQDPDQLAYAEEIDAMWVALNRNMKTLNGYTGNWPPDFKPQFYSDCSEFPNRILSYMKFEGVQVNQQNFDQLRKQFELIGFTNCNKEIDIENISPAIE